MSWGDGIVQAAASARSTRQRLLALVQARPGLPLGVIARTLGLGSGTVHYHLRRLEVDGRVHTLVTGRRRLAFSGPAGPSRTERARACALLRGRTARDIALAVLRRPGRSVLDLADEVGESPRAVYYHLKRLREAGLVVSRSRTRYQELEPAPDLAELVASVGEGAAVEGAASRA